MTDLTRINKPFGELDADTKGALLLAAHEGTEIELYHPHVGDWRVCQEPNWVDGLIYRVKTIPDTIDWLQVADGWAFCMRTLPARPSLTTEDVAHLYKADPSAPGSDPNTMFRALVTQSSYRKGTRHWKDSLIKRPGVEE